MGIPTGKKKAFSSWHLQGNSLANIYFSVL